MPGVLGPACQSDVVEWRGGQLSGASVADLLLLVRGHSQHATHADIAGDVAPAAAAPAASANLGYVELLSRVCWHWFVTLTFRPDHQLASGGMHPEKADKAFRVLLSKINREIYGTRWYKRPDGGLCWARGQEFHKSGRIHFHAVVAAPDADLNELTRRMRWVDYWWEEFGIARIERPSSQDHVTAYISKYVTKDGEVDFSPNFGRYVPPVLDFGNAAPPSPTSRTKALAAVAKRTGSHAIGEPERASRCLTLPLCPERLLLNKTHETANPRTTDLELDDE